MKRVAIIGLALVAGTPGCSDRGASGASQPAAAEKGWIRTGDAYSSDLRYPTPMTVVAPGTDSRANGTANAGALMPTSGGEGRGGEGGQQGTSSTGGPG